MMDIDDDDREMLEIYNIGSRVYGRAVVDGFCSPSRQGRQPCDAECPRCESTNTCYCFGKFNRGVNMGGIYGEMGYGFFYCKDCQLAWENTLIGKDEYWNYEMEGVT